MTISLKSTQSYWTSRNPIAYMKNFTLAFLFLIYSSTLQAQTFSLNRLNSFYTTYLTEQAAIVNDALSPTQPQSSPVGIAPIPGLLGYVPLVIQNSSGIDSSRLYVIGKGQHLTGLDQLFLQSDLTTGICTLVDSQLHNSVDADISVQLSKLPSAGTNSYFIYVPQMISGRFYMSVDSPLYMQTSTSTVGTTTNVMKIDDPSQTATQDPNYYVLYQDFEFTLDVNHDLFANVTNVDYYALSMTLGSYSYPSGNLYPTIDNLTVVGYPLTSLRSNILSSIKTGLQNDQSTTPQWSSLAVPFYENPYAASTPLTDLRILAAKLSIPLAGGDKFAGAANPQTFFDSIYLQNTTSGPSIGKSYMDELYTHYQSTSTLITIFPKDLPETTFTMTASTTANHFWFTSTTTTPINLELSSSPTSVSTSAFLSGAVGEWATAFTPGGTGAVNTELAKILSALFTAGLLPPPNTLAQPIVSDASYFRTYRSLYFNNPAGFTDHGPWYNLYDKAIHPLLIQTGGFGLGYAYDFDDLLDLAGLLHVNVQSNGVLNSAQPYALLTLGPIDTPVPNPTVAFGPYTLSVGALGALSKPIDIVYSTSPDQEPNASVSVSTPQQISTNVHNYFLVKYYTDPEKTSFFTYRVYPKYQLVLPTTNRYNALDTALMNGIIFTMTAPEAATSIFNFNVPNTQNAFP